MLLCKQYFKIKLNYGRSKMKVNSKIALQSKLRVFLAYYHTAEKENDQERKDKLEPYIEDLREEIKNTE